MGNGRGWFRNWRVGLVQWFLVPGLIWTSCGCGRSSVPSGERDPVLVAPPVPQEVLDRVLSPQQDDEAERPSPGNDWPGEVGQQLASELGEVLVSAAQKPETVEAGPAITVLFYTADWCALCRPAREKVVPWLKQQGYQVEIRDLSRPRVKQDAIVTPTALPGWVLVKEGREVARQVGGSQPAHLAELVRKHPATTPAIVSAWPGPTVRIADVVPLLAGTELKLGTAATVAIPATLSWTMQARPGQVTLSFDPAPHVTVHRILNWKVRLEGLVITPEGVTLQIDRLPDVMLKFDWSGPRRSVGSEEPVSPEADTDHALLRSPAGALMSVSTHQLAAASDPVARRGRPSVRDRNGCTGRFLIFTLRAAWALKWLLLVDGPVGPTQNDTTGQVA